jgi:hypothetical protein
MNIIARHIIDPHFGTSYEDLMHRMTWRAIRGGPYRWVQDTHDRVIRLGIEEFGGYEINTQAGADTRPLFSSS